MRWLLCMIVLLMCSVQAFAGNAWCDGTDPDFWDNKAVIVCEVQKFIDAGEASSIHVKVLAVVATDRLLPTDLEIEHELSNISRVGGFKPGPGQIYAFLIGELDGEWGLLGASVEFFESGNAVEPITGLKDPKLAKLAKRVVEVREKSRVNTVKYRQEQGQ